MRNNGPQSLHLLNEESTFCVKFFMISGWPYLMCHPLYKYSFDFALAVLHPNLTITYFSILWDAFEPLAVNQTQPSHCPQIIKDTLPILNQNLKSYQWHDKINPAY